MANVARASRLMTAPDTYLFEDDFINDQADTVMVDTVTDSGTVASGDAVGGIMVLTPSDGTVADNDEAYLATPNEVFKFAAGKPMHAVCRLQFTEANTDDANVAFGFQNAVGANSIVDNGAGVKTSGSGAMIYKVDGGTKWKCVTAMNGTITDADDTSTTVAGGSSYQVLEIDVVDSNVNSGYITVTFKVDGRYLVKSDGSVIKHHVAIASATEMQLWVGVKNGDTNLETLNVDYIAASQLR
jgi:hypothetical protein